MDNKTALTPGNIAWQIFVAFLIDFSGRQATYRSTP
jgi:hypothetical protein